MIDLNNKEIASLYGWIKIDAMTECRRIPGYGIALRTTIHSGGGDGISTAIVPDVSLIQLATSDYDGVPKCFYKLEKRRNREIGDFIEEES